MHDELFEKLDIVARYRAGPDVEARERFLRQASAEGHSRSTLKRIAWALLFLAEAVQSHVGSISSTQLRSCSADASGCAMGGGHRSILPDCSEGLESTGCAASVLCCQTMISRLGSLASWGRSRSTCESSAVSRR